MDKVHCGALRLQADRSVFGLRVLLTIREQLTYQGFAGSHDHRVSAPSTTAIVPPGSSWLPRCGHRIGQGSATHRIMHRGVHHNCQGGHWDTGVPRFCPSRERQECCKYNRLYIRYQRPCLPGYAIHEALSECSWTPKHVGARQFRSACIGRRSVEVVPFRPLAAPTGPNNSASRHEPPRARVGRPSVRGTTLAAARRLGGRSRARHRHAA